MSMSKSLNVRSVQLEVTLVETEKPLSHDNVLSAFLCDTASRAKCLLLGGGHLDQGAEGRSALARQLLFSANALSAWREGHTMRELSLSVFTCTYRGVLCNLNCQVCLLSEAAAPSAVVLRRNISDRCNTKHQHRRACAAGCAGGRSACGRPQRVQYQY